MNTERKIKLMVLGLEFDAEYLMMRDSEIEEIGKVCSPLKESHCQVSPSFVGIDISEAGSIHDYDYLTKPLLRKKWDDRFLRNMHKIIASDKGAPKHVTFLRRLRARAYYAAMRLFGGGVFTQAKEYFL